MSAVRCSGNLPESFQQAVGLLAKRWTPLILFVLSDGPRRFGEIASQIEFVSDRMLSERLKELEAEGLIERQVYAEVPVRVEYRLTEKGDDLRPVLLAICQWATTWLGAAGRTCDTSAHAAHAAHARHQGLDGPRGEPPLQAGRVGQGGQGGIEAGSAPGSAGRRA